ncbi:MAG: PIG-L family deacetylase [Actinomycetota bacterium]|nr:PIG-L family deacetylase [Actinomycetota bacterium]
MTGALMLSRDRVASVLVLSPHADDEVLGCGGLLGRLAGDGASVHVVYGAVDGFHHYGTPADTSFAQRTDEIESVAELFGWTYEILYGGKDLIEKLDTVPRRDLVDQFETAMNLHRPQLLLLPCGVDYDQDHVAFFQAGFAAARPIAPVFGKWLVPHVLTYEMTKIQWAWEPLPRSSAFVDITDHLGTKLEGVRRYASQLRPTPHIRSLESVTALASIRGKEIGVEYAEAFGVLRTVL